MTAGNAELIAELNRAKVAFQMRALCAALGMENVRVEVTTSPLVADGGRHTDAAPVDLRAPLHGLTVSSERQQDRG